MPTITSLGAIIAGLIGIAFLISGGVAIPLWNISQSDDDKAATHE